MGYMNLQANNLGQECTWMIHAKFRILVLPKNSCSWRRCKSKTFCTIWSTPSFWLMPTAIANRFLGVIFITWRGKWQYKETSQVTPQSLLRNTDASTWTDTIPAIWIQRTQSFLQQIQVEMIHQIYFLCTRSNNKNEDIDSKGNGVPCPHLLQQEFAFASLRSPQWFLLVTALHPLYTVSLLQHNRHNPVKIETLDLFSTIQYNILK